MEIVAEALREARERLGLSQEAAAEAVGINRVLLSYYETGRRQVPFTVLAALARLYGIPVTALLEGKVGQVGDEVPAEVLYRAAPQPLSDRAAAGIHRFVQLVRAYVELLEEVGAPVPGPGASPFPAPTARPSRQLAARLARQVRGWLGLGGGPVGDLFRILDEHVLAFRLPLGSDLSATPSGVFYNHPQAGFCILVNSDMTLGRQLFTLAHELAHALFHSQRTTAWISMPGAAAGRERFADLFAGEFLVPGDTLAGVIDELQAWEEVDDPVVVVHLQRHFGVSYAAMLVRLRQAGFIDAEQYERLSGISPTRVARQLGYPVDPADRGDYELSPLERLPDRFLRLVRAALKGGVITQGDAAETLSVNVEDIRLLLSEPKAEPAEHRALEDLEAALGAR